MNFIDVRTPQEFNSGSVPNSINIPLNEVVARINELKELQPMLIFCAAGVRAQRAVDYLKQNGITEAKNGGSWLEVNATLAKYTKEL